MCLTRVESFLNVGKTDEAISGLSFLCTSRGDAESCVGAAALLAKEKKTDSARTILARACTPSVAKGCDLLAELSLAKGDFDAAARAYDQACALKEDSACEGAARARASLDKRKELETACNAGEPEPCLKLQALAHGSPTAAPISVPRENGGDHAPSSGVDEVPDPTASADVLYKVKTIRAKNAVDPAMADAQIAGLCDAGLGYACALVGNTAMVQGRSAVAKQESENGCRVKSASSCFVRYAIAKGEENDSEAERYFSLTCQYGGLKYCAEVRKHLGAERLPAQTR